MITEDAVDGPVSFPERLGGKVTCVLVLGGRGRGVGARGCGWAEVIYLLEDQF
jgi:hypothetical protein